MWDTVKGTLKRDRKGLAVRDSENKLAMVFLALEVKSGPGEE